MARDNAVLDQDRSTDSHEDDATTRRSYLKAAGAATAVTIAATGAVNATGDDLPNLLTVVGQGAPSSYEITVDGEIEMVADDHVEEATIVSGTAVEGAIVEGEQQFRFSGDLTDVTFVDRGVTGVTPAAVPNVHVDYGAPEQ
ncbi:hypothetical protein ACYJ1Y_13460 [Natrialbaceae archaeon A-gly3]